MEFTLPHIGEGVNEAELVRWLVQPGDAVRRGQNLLEVMTDKATMEVPSPFVGTIDSLAVEPGLNIKVGQTVLAYHAAKVDAPTTPVVVVPEPKGNGAPSAAPPPPRAPVSVKAAPSVRHMARKLGVDLAGVSGSGPEGRVLIEDLTRHGRPPVGRDEPSRPIPRPDFGKPGTRLPMIGLRRKIAEQMVRSKNAIPHYAYVDECDVTAMVKLREQLKDTYARAGIKLTYLPFFVKAAVAALKDVPVVNSSLSEDGEAIVLHDRYNVGIAVAAPAGLMVPVVRDADKKTLGELAREIDRISTDARAGKPRLEDLRGGTFTVTSVGGIGGLFSTPVINHPEAGILGIGKVAKRPVFDDDERVRAAQMVYLSLSFDHRIVDGAVGAAFCNAMIRHLGNPALLLLGDKL